MNATRACVAAAVVVVLALAGCPGDPRELTQSRIVARVGDDEIRAAALLAVLAQRGTARIASDAERLTVAHHLLDEMIDDHLLFSAAQAAGVTVRPEDVERELRSRAEQYPPGVFQRTLVAEQMTLKELRSRVERRLLVDAFVRTRLSDLPAISDDDVLARFKQGEPKTRPAQVHARQILVRTPEEAQHVLEQIRSRKLSFEAAAQKFSTAPDAEDGGDLGFFAKGELPDAFDICFNLEAGTVSDVVASGLGFHIFWVLEHRDAEVETFEVARDRIAEDIARERQSEALAKLTADLRAQQKISINATALSKTLALLPPPPATPNLALPEDGAARPLDSHSNGIDPIPELKRD